MTWHHVLRRDLTSAYRSRTVPVVAVLVLLVTVVAIGTIAVLADPEYPPPMSTAVMLMGTALSFVLPLVALIGTYAALVGERTTGSVRFLLGLPNSRTDAYLGKYLSRSLIVLVPLAVGVLLSAAIVAGTYRQGSFLDVALLGLASVPFAAGFVGVGLSASAVADTDNRAVAIAVGAFALLRAGWPAMQWLGLEQMADAYPRPEWYFWLGRINPINAYVRVTQAFGDVPYHPLLTTPGPEAVQTFATSLEFALAIVLVWAVVPPFVGYVAYRRRDLL